MKGQASIEFLLVFVALLFFISFFVSSFQGIESSSRILADFKTAEIFASDLSEGYDSLALMGDGSSLPLKYPISAKWRFNGNELLIVDSNKSVKVELDKRIEYLLKRDFYSGKFSVLLKKSGGSIVLVDN